MNWVKISSVSFPSSFHHLYTWLVEHWDRLKKKKVLLLLWAFWFYCKKSRNRSVSETGSLLVIKWYSLVLVWGFIRLNVSGNQMNSQGHLVSTHTADTHVTLSSSFVLAHLMTINNIYHWQSIKSFVHLFSNLDSVKSESKIANFWSFKRIKRRSENRKFKMSQERSNKFEVFGLPDFFFFFFTSD